MEIILRKQAKHNNLKFYFTGQPCSKGHVDQRRTVNGECNTCAMQERKRNQAKRQEEFVKKHGIDYKREISKQHYQTNKAIYKKRAIEWNKKHCSYKSNRHREYMKHYLRKWQKDNVNKMKQYLQKWSKVNGSTARRRWNQQNKGKKNYYTRMRQWVIRRATPSWANLTEIKQIYINAAIKTKETNLPHEVDHIIPLQGKLVCGLHVACNLQILQKDIHKFKLNKF